MSGKGDRRQLSMDGYFTVPREPSPTPAAFDFDAQLRNLITRAIKESEKSRAETAAAMTDLIFGDAGDGEITKAQIDSWTAPSRTDWRFPLCYLPALIQATGAVWLLDRIAQMVGCKVLIGEQALLAQWGALEIQDQKIKADKQRLKKLLGADAAERLLAGAGKGGRS